MIHDKLKGINDMAAFNRVILLGHLTRDVEMRFTPNNTAVASTGIAMTRKWKDAQGQAKEEVCFVDITAFGSQAEVMSKYTAKGDLLHIEGRLRLDTWDDKNGGGKRSKHSVVVESIQLMPRKDAGGQKQPKQQPQPTQVDAGDVPF